MVFGARFARDGLFEWRLVREVVLDEFCRRFWLCDRQWCLVFRVLGCPYSMSIVWLAILSTNSFVFLFYRAPFYILPLDHKSTANICWPKEFESNCSMLFNQQLGYRQLYFFLGWAFVAFYSLLVRSPNLRVSIRVNWLIEKTFNKLLEPISIKQDHYLNLRKRLRIQRYLKELIQLPTNFLNGSIDSHVTLQISARGNPSSSTIWHTSYPSSRFALDNVETFC